MPVAAVRHADKKAKLSCHHFIVSRVNVNQGCKMTISALGMRRASMFSSFLFPLSIDCKEFGKSSSHTEKGAQQVLSPLKSDNIANKDQKATSGAAQGDREEMS